MSDTPFVAIALLLLAAFLVGGVLGYAARRYLFAPRGRARETRTETPADILKQEEKLAEEETSPEPELVPGPVPGSSEAGQPAEPAREPPLLSEPRDGRGDNLKKIKGIGSKLEQALNGIGVYHFDQISGWDDRSVAWVDDKLDLRGRITRDDWVAQAKALTAKTV